MAQIIAAQAVTHASAAQRDGETPASNNLGGSDLAVLTFLGVAGAVNLAWVGVLVWSGANAIGWLIA